MSVIEEEALSTRPAEPVAPRGSRSTRVLLRQGWRRLTSMRTALQLLFLLSLAAVPGGLLPQRGQEPQRVATYLTTHRTLGPILDNLSLFDVFAAPWFAAIYLLLFISLIGCLIPRIRLHARALRRKPPATPARLDRLPGGYTTYVSDRSPEQVLAAARPLLRGWRVAERGTSLSAERGYSRETGNLVFHVSLVVLLLGVGFGSVLGYEGDRVLADGPVSAVSSTTFTNSRIGYDEYRPGRLLSDGSLTPWSLQLDQFVATYRDDGSPADYVAHTTFTTPGKAPRPVDIKVNSPLAAGSGAEVYLLNHGYAPVFQLHDRTGAVVQTSQPVICSPIESRNLLSRCIVSFGGLPKDPKTGADSDLAFDLEFAPTGSFAANGDFVSSFPTLKQPVMTVTTYVGNLGHPANVESLDPRLLTTTGKVSALILNDPKLNTLSGLPGGFSLTVESHIPQWASFQVKRDPAKKIVLVAAIGMVAGLLLSLRVRRRRLWVRAVPLGGGAGGGTGGGADPNGSGDGARRTLVEVGGLARSDAAACREELDRLVATLQGATGRTAVTAGGTSLSEATQS